MRVLVYGNAGSGKTTYAKVLARAHHLQHLDLDAIVWEGCYGDLVEMASADCTELIFLDPGEAACVAHCRARPWEPHKYASEVEQNRMLPALIDWVRGYYHRNDAWSRVAHQRLFRAFDGPKRVLIEPIVLPADAG